MIWSAELRNESNYIRQNILISTDRKPVAITSVSFFDGTLTGAKYSGSVLGAPITCENFFFGMENPVAQSKALINRLAGRLAPNPVDVSHIIEFAGEYTVSVEYGSSHHDFNIESFQLTRNGTLISEDKHVLNGKNGSTTYRFVVENYQKDDTPDFE